MNEFPDFLSGEERDCCQHVLIQHLTESVKVKVQVILFRRVCVWSLRIQINVITARKRSCGKVMFLQVSVHRRGVGASHASWDRSHGKVTSSGGHRNTYVWQAGGMHPTGMLSCYLCEFVKISIFLFTILE